VAKTPRHTEVRRTIARILTVLRERQTAERQTADGGKN